MMRSAWCVGVTATSLLLMASTALAQSFCSDLDPLVKLAPSGFRSILDDANGGPIESGVTRICPALLGAGMRRGRKPIGARGMFQRLKWEVRSTS